MQVERGGPELATAEWERVFDRLAEAGVLFLTLTKGEPTVRDDLVDLVRAGRTRHFAVKLKTNGLRLDEATCDALSAAPVMEVHFSFYSADPAIHDGITRVPSSHAKVVAAARRLRKNGTRVLLNCPLLADNFDGYGEVAAFAEAEGMGCLLDPGIRAQEDGCAEPADRRLEAGQLKRLLGDSRVFPDMSPSPIVDRLARPGCNVGKAMVAVAPNGDVWPCLSLRERLGNLLESDLASIWVGNPALEKYTCIRWRDLPVCRECDVLPYCDRCHANALSEDGDLLGPSRLACRLARARADEAERRRRACG
jgi:radical SAM protein with 4Fe4S-binding SPASM domain